MKKKLIFILINLVIAAVIAFFLYQKFYSRQIIFDGTFDTRPIELIEVKNRYFPPSRDKTLNLVFILNEIPRGMVIETLERLQMKFEYHLSTRALFTKRFNPERKLNFPHCFASNLEVFCKTTTKIFRGNYFVVLKEDKIVYVDDQFEISHLALLLEKKINPDSSYKDFSISTARLEKKVIERIRKGSFNLLHLQTGDSREVWDIVNNVSKMYLIHASCSSCKLKAMFNDIRI
ncbi:MAG: hypothetical protein GY765_27460 [bacterium]|nr:hypothetical protein [bacterium]